MVFVVTTDHSIHLDIIIDQFWQVHDLPDKIFVDQLYGFVLSWRANHFKSAAAAVVAAASRFDRRRVVSRPLTSYSSDDDRRRLRYSSYAGRPPSAAFGLWYELAA